MVGPIETVDKYINERVYVIDENSTVEKARTLMAENNTDFLVVTRTMVPVYTLKKYQTLGEKPDTTILSLANAGKLEPAVVVFSGMPWIEVAYRLKETTVIIVVDKFNYPQIRGAISIYKIKWETR